LIDIIDESAAQLANADELRSWSLAGTNSGMQPPIHLL
jgi:hypothetical protein